MQLYIYYINCPVLPYRVVSLNNCKSIFLSAGGVHGKYQLHQASFPVEILAPVPTPSKPLMILLIIRSAIVLGIIMVHWYNSRQLTKSYHFRITLGIDALGDMRRICGTTVAEGKNKTCKGSQGCYFKYVYFFYKFNLSRNLQ